MRTDFKLMHYQIAKSVDTKHCFDVIIVGAGFAGLYRLHRMRQQGLKCRVRWLTRACGIPPRSGPPRNALLLLRSDREATTRVLRKVLEWPFERIVVAHGTSVEVGAREAFRKAFSEFL
ncbi:MAG: hypothetical protein ACT4QA_18965 [Panacagrimonas sp.]